MPQMDALKDLKNPLRAPSQDTFSILVAQMSEVEFRYPNPNWYKVCDKIAILFAKMWLLQGERGRPWRWNTNVATSALR